MEIVLGLDPVDEQCSCDDNEQQLSDAYRTLIQLACQASNKLNDIIGGKQREERLKDIPVEWKVGGDVPFVVTPISIPDWKTANHLNVMKKYKIQ